jgi:hypothetical protein
MVRHRYLRVPLIHRPRKCSQSVIRGGQRSSWIGDLKRRSCGLARTLGDPMKCGMRVGGEKAYGGKWRPRERKWKKNFHVS